jgi:PTH1 family peptidyl-tRNA hydrolase
VRDLLARYELTPADLIILYDDVALPWGMIRIRERGSAGSHNGLKSVIGAVETDEFIRVRLGVEPDHPVGDLKEYVLHPMSKSSLEVAAEMIAETAGAIEMILEKGVATAMNRYNKRVSPEDEDLL